MMTLHSRRSLLARIGGGALIFGASASLPGCAGELQATSAPKGQTGAPLQAPGFDELTASEWASVTEADWRDRLSPEAYAVLRQEGTERAFTSALNDEKRTGWFACAGCGLILFSSAKKYDSGTGWPSFMDAIPERLGTKADRKLWYTRTEYHCVRCGGHQGHVFEDGPAPTGQRWCNNGVALVFVPTDELS